MEVRPKQISIEDGIPGQLMGIVGDEWAPVNPPTGGGGGGGGSGAFFDDFERDDTPLAGNNGWAAATTMAAANGDTVATFYIQSGVVKQTGFGGYPILHDRQSDVEGVADVQCDVGFYSSGSVGSSMGIIFAATPDCSEGMGFSFDGTYWGIDRYADGHYSGSPSVITDHGWVTWGFGDPMKIRCVYTEATYTLEVYQNDVLALTIDVSDENGGFWFGHEVAALSTMTHGGFYSNAGDHANTFDNFSVDQATEVGGPTGPVLDDLTDVDTTTIPPADQQFLKFDLATNLWVPADLPSSSTGAPFEITDTPPDPPPYAGYAYMNSDGKVRIWNGTGWRQILTTAYTPPAEGDAIYMLESLVGRYRASSLEFANGDPVTAWLDESGLDNDLIVDSAGTMVVSGINTLKSVRFENATLYQLPASVPRPVTVIAVIDSDAADAGSILFSNPTPIDSSYAYTGYISGAGWRLSDGNTVYVDLAEPSPGNPHVIYARISATGMMVGADGGQTNSVATMDFHPKRIGNWSPGSNYSMEGLVSEMLVYNDTITDDELNAIVHDLGLVYGITTSV